MSGFDITQIEGLEDFVEERIPQEYISIVNNSTKFNKNNDLNYNNGDIYLSSSKTRIGSMEKPFKFVIIRMFDTYVVWDQKTRKPKKFTYNLEVGGAWSDGSPITQADLEWEDVENTKTGKTFKAPKYTKTLNLVVCIDQEIQKEDPKYYILALGAKNTVLKDLIIELKKYIKSTFQENKISKGAFELIFESRVKVEENNDGDAWYEWAKPAYVRKLKEDQSLHSRMLGLTRETKELAPRPFTITQQAQIEAPKEETPSQLTAGGTDDFSQDLSTPAIDVTGVPTSGPKEIEEITELNVDITATSAF